MQAAVVKPLNWVTIDGKLFGIETRTILNRNTGKKSKHKHYGEYFQYTTTINKHNGYVYAPIKFIKENPNLVNKIANNAEPIINKELRILFPAITFDLFSSFVLY